MKVQDLLTAFLLCACLSFQAYAGAWPRGEGQVFLSFKGENASGGSAWASAWAIYAEYGLSAKSTLGGELRFPSDSTDEVTGYIAARRLIAMISPSDPFALSAGIGRRDFGTGTAFAISPGMHFGHGFETPLGNGWATLDGWLHLPLNSGNAATQVETQIGTRISVNWLLMLGASRYSTDTSESTRITPSVAFRIGGDRTIQFSYTEEFGDTIASSVAASLWMEF